MTLNPPPDSPITPLQWAIAALILTLVLIASAASAQEISGPAVVIDGDSIKISGERVRLCGIDSPETSTDAGKAARAWAMANWSNVRVTCSQRSTDRYRRVVAVCYRFIPGEGLSDLALEALATGHAVQWARYWKGCGYHSQTLPNAR